jgi:CO dehydrogenase/acetyl-CoA synthase gamma subunit (corrinoid Fe-S protein)
MMKLKYAGGEIYISDLASTVLLRYAQALAVHSTSDTVVLPAITMDGQAGDTLILIGPASELLVIPTTVIARDIDDGDAIALMTKRTAALQPHRPVTTGDYDAGSYSDEFGLG